MRKSGGKSILEAEMNNDIKSTTMMPFEGVQIYRQSTHIAIYVNGNGEMCTA
jgi:hypothetical protein